MKPIRILDIGSDPDEDPDLRIRKRTAVAAALVFLAVGVVFGLADLVRARPELAALALVEVIAFTAALIRFGRTHRLTPLVATMAVVGLAILLVSLVPTGGLTWGAANLMFAVLVPLAAVLFLGGRAGPPALAGVILVVAAAVLFVDPSERAAPPEASVVRTLFIAIEIVVTAALALGLVSFIDGERLRAKAESEALLLNILPRSIADRLKRGERVIADQYDDVTILFADVVDFTPFAADATPARVVDVLNEVFSRFDTLAQRFGLEKIKTIGDAYMVVAGAPEPRADHAAVIVEMAIEMLTVAAATEPTPGKPIRLRVGIASGPVVAGVIGHRKFSYDLWGDAVNLASRMESTGIPGSIQVAASTWRHCRDRYAFRPREVDVKGLGMMRTYLLDPTRPASGPD